MKRILTITLLLVLLRKAALLRAQSNVPDFTVHSSTCFGFVFSGSPEEAGFPYYSIGIELVDSTIPHYETAILVKENAGLAISIEEIYQFIYSFPPRSPRHVELDSLILPGLETMLEHGYSRLTFKHHGLKWRCMAVCASIKYFEFENEACSKRFIIGISKSRPLTKEEKRKFLKKLRQL